MSEFKEWPWDVKRHLMTFLTAQDKFSLAEAYPTFNSANPIQLVHKTKFKVLKRRTSLVLILTETNCVSATKAALRKNKLEVHLIISRSMVESTRMSQQMDLAVWINKVTDDGKTNFYSIELWGSIRMYGAIFGNLAR